MKCDACGAPVENGVCTYCGKKFPVTPDPSVGAVPQGSVMTNVYIQEEPVKKKGMINCATCGKPISKNAKTCPYCGAKVKKPIYKRPWFIAIIVLLLIGAIGSAGGSKSENTDKTPAVTQDVQTQDDVSNNTETTVDVPAEESEVDVPTEYKNALKKAESYSKLMYMSKKAIYDQLTSEYGEKFPADAAQYAIDNLEADYFANALEKAKSYQKLMNMSKSAIYDQLISEYGEQFTPEEAQYAIDHLE